MAVRSMSCAAAVAILTACHAHPPPAPPRHTNLGLQISRLELSNGLQVVLVHDPQAPEVQVTMRYRVGSVDDPAGQEGMAHLVEHLMFQQVLGAQSLFAHLENDATYFNGETTFDATTYVARAQVAHLDELLSIEAVRVGSRCTSITESAFEREREVVINEGRQHGDSFAIVDDIHQGLYPEHHPYGRPRRGVPAVIGAITRDQACAFADAHYAPGNAVLVISGDVTPEQVTTSMKKFLARVPKRAIAPSRPVPRVDLAPRRLEASAAIEDDALIVAWPLPPEPLLRSRVLAIASATVSLVDDAVAGSASLVPLGDGRAPMLAIVVQPTADETMDDVIDRVRHAIDSTPAAFEGSTGARQLDEVMYDRVQQSAIYRLFSTLEDGGDRDTHLAAYVIAGRDPRTALGAEFQGLRELTRAGAAQVAREQLAFDQASVLVLRPRVASRRGHDIDLAAPAHDVGQRRDPPDPAEAHQPLTGSLGARGFAGMQTRELPNGLHVVLLPMSSVPTVELRLVFDAGTADDPAGKQGLAQIAARTLSFDLHYLNDLLLFAAAGGSDTVDVDVDRTTFVARGLDMHLDMLLAGLRRWVRDGRYEFDDADLARARRRQAKLATDTGMLNEAWRVALFGAGHPYVTAGMAGSAADVLHVADAEAFRRAHFTPDNATLVIAGGFDAALADRWIDYLFGDWQGTAVARTRPPIHPTAASIGRTQDTTQAQLLVGLPATTGDRANRLVAAAMLAEIAGDVRHQLGASYGLDASLAETRLATLYAITGWVEAARVRETVELLRSRLDALRTDPDVAARTFVTARRRVLAHLVSLTGSAGRLAERVDRDVALGRPPLSDLQTATAVQALTIDQMAATLAEVDLARAAILVRGPDGSVRDAFGALGRTPTLMEPTAPHREVAAVDVDAGGDAHRDRDTVRLSDLSDALTTQGAPTAYTLGASAGLATGSVLRHGGSGWTVAAEAAYRFDTTTALGLHVAVGHMSGAYDTDDVNPVHHTFTSTSFDVGGLISALAYDRLWGELLAGLHVDHVDDAGARWEPGLGVGLEGGVDVVKLGTHRLDVIGRMQSELVPAGGFVEFSIGLGYRR